MDSQYEIKYNNLMQGLEEMHEKNVKRTRAALRCLLIIPAVILLMLFMTKGSKTIFLVLWIVSMFIIASVLIVIEYQDYKLQKMFKKNADNEIAVSTEIAAPQSDSPSKERIEEIRRSIRSRIPTSPAENTASDSEKSETVNV